MEILERLSNSKFRSSFKLREKDIEYINNVGIEKIKKHAIDFVIERLSKKEITNDGKQTPMRGHPVFVAMHATATCCRGCLYKWHKIEKNKELSKEEIIYIANLILKWIKKELENKNTLI
jgi:hypothetical protein